MNEFVSWQSYFHFANSVRRKSRYVFEPHVNAFLQAVLATCAERELELEKGSFLWRAQVGHEWKPEPAIDDQVPFPFPPERMKPLSDSAREGRVNPKGIPCLYLATDAETAVAEVRPWIGSYVSVGQFKTAKQLRLVDCSVKSGSSRIYFHEPEPEKREESVWKDIDRAFSDPINSSDETADYAPTQILAEAFRSRGYAGIAYKSALGKGLNIALFDISAADLVSCHLYEVRKISVESAECTNPYYIRE